MARSRVLEWGVGLGLEQGRKRSRVQTDIINGLDALRVYWRVETMYCRCERRSRKITDFKNKVLDIISLECSRSKPILPQPIRNSPVVIHTSFLFSRNNPEMMACLYFFLGGINPEVCWYFFSIASALLSPCLPHNVVGRTQRVQNGRTKISLRQQLSGELRPKWQYQTRTYRYSKHLQHIKHSLKTILNISLRTFQNSQLITSWFIR